MRAETTQTDVARLLKPFSKADIFARPASAVVRGALRMEAGFYGSQGYRALQAMEKSGFEIGRVSNIAEVRWFGPFPRTYVDDPSAGVPFLSSSEIMAAKLEPKNYLSKALTPNLERLLVSKGTILVSCSGTIGNVVICTKEFDGYAVSQHAIRVDSKRDIDRGVLYVFLLSELGQFLVTRNKSGSVIESIYADDVESLPFPNLPKQLRQRIFEKIQRACELRVKANVLLNDADGKVEIDCKLPPFSSIQKSPFVRTAGARLVFRVSVTERLGLGKFGQLRLDATYHEPLVVALSKLIFNREDGTTLGRLLRGVRNSTLRKRIYVENAEDGVPLLGGKQLMESHSRGIKYLSKTLTRHVNNELVQEGWTIVSCAGTLGKTIFVHRNWEGNAVSQNVMGIIPNPEKIFPGFIYAFLASEYGQSQILQRGHGSVIPFLRDFQFNSIAIVIPADKGKGIHDLVISAYEARGDAKALEDEAIGLFMTAIERGRDVTEQEWGREY